MTKKDKWEDIFRGIGVTCHDPVHFVTADQVRRFSGGEEPRLMASMTAEDKQPDIFRRHGAFILPVAPDKYVIVKGKGYHELEPTGAPRKFQARFPFEMVMLAYGKGETRHLLHAHHSGLLSRFAGVPQLYETMSGKGRTGRFNFRVDGSPVIEVRSAGMEIDKGFEGPNDLLLFEAKAKVPRTFLVRQLYYPYRVASGITTKAVRAFFFAANTEENTYNIWEYRWQDPLDYEDIHLVKAGSFLIEEAEPPSDKLESIQPDPSLDIVPQANDFQKVADFPLLIHSGIDTAARWALHYGITRRQGGYYREATQAFGLVRLESGRIFLTEEGRRYVALEPLRRADFLAERLLMIPLMNEVFRLVLANGERGVGKGEITKLIARRPYLSGTVLPRRASTVVSYFRWLARTTGSVVVRDGRIYRRDGPLDRFA